MPKKKKKVAKSDGSETTTMTDLEKKARLAKIAQAAEDKKAKAASKTKRNAPKAPDASEDAPQAPADAPKGDSASDDASHDEALSVSDIARELELDPKAARAKLRKAGLKEELKFEGRWPKAARGSDLFKRYVEVMTYVEVKTETVEVATPKDEEPKGE